MKAKPIKERLLDALKRRGGRGQYHAVMADVFPRDQYPRAYRNAVQGGPPGCAFAFGRAIRELGIYDNYKLGSERFISLKDRT